MNISSAARAAARCIAAPFVALGRFARSLQSVKNRARAAPPPPRDETPRRPSITAGSFVYVISPPSPHADASSRMAEVTPLCPANAGVAHGMDAAVRRARVADAVALALKDAPLFSMEEQLPSTLDARVDSLDLRGELRGRTIADAHNDVMNMLPADPVFSTSDPYHFIQRFTAVALERERHSYLSGMEALGKEAAIDRLVDQFVAAEEQLKQEAVDRVFSTSPGH